MFAGGCEELDWTLSVLFDGMGAMSTRLQRHAAEGLARLRHEARRLRHRRRRRRRRAGGARARQGARREESTARSPATARPPTASTWWRRRAKARRAACGMALADGEGADRLHQPARHLDADRRRARDRGDPRGVRHRRQMPADRGDEVADRPFARRDRRAGDDLLPADDAERLHLRERQHRRARPEIRRHADRARAARRRRAQHACSPTRSASAAPTPRWCSSATPVEDARHEQSDGRQARPDHGRRQRSLDRLGHRQAARGGGRRARLHLSGRAFRQAREAARHLARLDHALSLRRGGSSLHAGRLRRASHGLGQPRLRRPRHRLLRQGGAEGPLRRHVARELLPHHADLLLLVHRGGAAWRRR